MSEQESFPEYGEQNISGSISTLGSEFKHEFGPLFGLRNFLSEIHYNSQRLIRGRILTIIDASISDPVQKKALKDLINQSFESDYMDWLRHALLRWSEAHCNDKEWNPTTKERHDYFLGIVSGTANQSGKAI